jgi:hypothetical protein
LIDVVAPLTREGAALKPEDLEEAAWDQHFVVRWSQCLPAKAEESLQELQAMYGDDQESGLAAEPGAPHGELLLADLSRCVKKASEAAPQVHDLTDQATADLAADKPLLALPKQRKALALLEEILAALPETARQASQRRRDQSPQAENELAKAGDLPNSTGKLPQIGQTPSHARSQQNRSGQPRAEPGKLSQPQRQGDLSLQHAEALMRQVRQRQQQRRVMERQEQSSQAQAITVEKDW